MPSRELHTAEHIFARALQNFGVNLHVIKVDTESGATGTAFFEEKIDVGTLLQASAEVNNVIRKALSVSERFFDSIEKAKLEFPSLRLNEERLQGKEKLRLVKIGDYDFAMCKHLHVENTSQIIAFALSSVSHPDGKTKIEFLAANDAIDYLSKIGSSAILTSTKYNFPATAIGDKYKAMVSHEEELRKEIASLLSAALDSGARVLYLKEFEIGALYEQARKHILRHTSESISLIGDSQIICLSGESSPLDFRALGDRLSQEGLFSGAAKDHSLNGKITNPHRIKSLVEEFIYTGKPQIASSSRKS